MTVKTIFDLPIGPGLYTEQTERGAQGRWKDADKVRFRAGLAEKIGGWVRLQPQFRGTARRLRDWTSLDGNTWTAIGTDKKLYLWRNEALYDITPLRDSGVLTAPFSVTASSAVVTVNHVNHGLNVGDFVRFDNAIDANGILVDGEYEVQTVNDGDNYTIVDDTTASTTGSNLGGTPSYEYDIPIGTESVTTATGWGTGRWGTDRVNGWNTPAAEGVTLLVGIRTWALDNWGEDLLACPRGGQIYWWDKSRGTDNRAEALGGDAPPICESMIISQRDRHVIALGAYDYFNNKTDPLLIRWSSTEDLDDWVPTSTNTSGDLRLYSGSKIVTAVRSRLETIVFTDVSVHTLPFIGGFDVFGLNIVGENVSILGPNCAVPVDSRVFFMAEADFYVYDGIVRVLPCDVRNFVYDNLNVIQKDKIYGGLNREFNEVWWFYPSYDPNTWVQQDFSLGLPPDYSIANASVNTDTVLFQADFEGPDNSQTYTEESPYAAVATFTNGPTQTRLETTNPLFGTSSLYTAGNDDPSDEVTFPIQVGDRPDWDATGKYMTAEWSFRADSMPTNSFDDRSVMMIGDSDFNICRLAVEWSSGSGIYIRCGFANSGGIIDINPDPVAGTDYTVVCEADYTGGAGNGVERVWFGPKNGTLNLVNTATGLTAKDPTSLSTNTIHVANSAAFDNWAGHIDHCRIKISDAAYYGTGSTITADAVFASPGAGDVGYIYAFDPSGYTEVQATADNEYEHDFFLTNDEPILTPTTSEYAVELDVNPSIGVDTGLAGLSFLRTDLQGTQETHADDCQQWMVELDYANDQVIVVKKEGAAPAAPDNQGTNTVDFTTLTGSAMATGTKYLIAVQFDTPQITIWVDGNQAFQFDMSAAELALFTSGTSGLHMRANANNTDDYRFYNFAVGPIGSITAPDFDISPVEANRYVAFNYEEGTWTIGKMARTAWADRSPQLEKAYAAAPDGYIYQHETGTDDNGAAMPAYIQSFDMEIPQAGEELMHVDQLIPDFLTLEGECKVYLTGRKYPQDINRISKGPYTVSPGVRKLSTRIRARQIALRVESDATGDRWRFGTWRGRAGPHGKRG